MARSAWVAFLVVGCCEASGGRAGPHDPSWLAGCADDVRADAPASFTVVTADPFVVAGDGPDVEVLAREVVLRPSRRLEAQLFPLRPKRAFTIWVFDSEDSYYRNANVLLGDIPPSPYGYFDPCAGTLVVNAAFGTGTLVHEIVHAYVRANYDSPPVWIDEGLASLFEHTEERDGRLVGRVNWRLPGLQEHLRERRAPILAPLLDASRGDFDDEEEGATLYAAARYLCFYMQERDVLARFARAYAQTEDQDPSGRRALTLALGNDDLHGIETRWRNFVLALEPESGGGR